MTKKNERREIARKLKVTKLPLPIRYRIAKRIVREESFREIILSLGATEKTLPFCSCCGPSTREYVLEGKTFLTEYGALVTKSGNIFF